MSSQGVAEAQRGKQLAHAPYNYRAHGVFSMVQGTFHVLYKHKLLSPSSSPVRQVHYYNLCCTDEETEAQGG